MNEINLSYEQNIKAAMVFLSMFGLSIEERENISSGENLNVINLNSEKVGCVDCIDSKICISVQTELGIMYAYYKTENVFGFTDRERPNYPSFTGWNTDINYTILKNNKEEYKGIFMVDYSFDEEFGAKCICRPTLDYFIDNKKVMSLKFQLDGETFNLQFFEGDRHERINLMPFDSLNGYITHFISSRKWDVDNGSYPYRKYSCIVEYGEKGEKLKAFSITEENNKILEINNIYQDKIGFNKETCQDKRELLIQMGNLMKEIDPNMYGRIEYAQVLLATMNISLLDNFINVSLKSYSDEEIQALLGIKRDSIKYENAIRQLKQVYPKI